MGSVKLQRCDCCAQPVTVTTGGEGTSSYDPVCEDALRRVTAFLDRLKADLRVGIDESYLLSDAVALETSIREVLNAPNTR
jgi:hypothetical protein